MNKQALFYCIMAFMIIIFTGCKSEGNQQNANDKNSNAVSNTNLTQNEYLIKDNNIIKVNGNQQDVDIINPLTQEEEIPTIEIADGKISISASVKDIGLIIFNLDRIAKDNIDFKKMSNADYKLILLFSPYSTTGNACVSDENASMPSVEFYRFDDRIAGRFSGIVRCDNTEIEIEINFDDFMPKEKFYTTN